jgi:hypothetical protein
LKGELSYLHSLLQIDVKETLRHCTTVVLPQFKPASVGEAAHTFLRFLLM